MDAMTIFNVAAGLCSIISLFLAFKANERVTKIENQYNTNSNNQKTTIKQSQKGENNIQVGQDYIQSGRENDRDKKR